jgi:hypothetical protein
MPIKDPIKRAQYHRAYYMNNKKKLHVQTYKSKHAESIVDDSIADEPTTDVEYSDDEDDDEIQQINRVTPPPTLKKNYYQQPYDVDHEYDRFLYNREYIPYPPHIHPFIQHNLRNIQPSRPMVQQPNLNLPLKYTFV